MEEAYEGKEERREELSGRIAVVIVGLSDWRFVSLP